MSIPINKLKIKDQRFLLQDWRIPGIDVSPVENSENLITSGAIANLREEIFNTFDLDPTVIPNITASIEDLASHIKIESISVNGSELPIVSKNVSITIPTNLSDLLDNATHRTVTDSEKASWNAKQDLIQDLEQIRQNAVSGGDAYHLPQNGIPKTDLSNEVQSLLDLARTALQTHQNISNKADKANTVSNVLYGNKALYKTINGSSIEVFSINTLKSDLALNKADFGLSNVDNTSDLNKPVSRLTQRALDNKVDKVGNKVLSSNDYTNADKLKLGDIETGAQVNVIERIQINGVSQMINNKTVNLQGSFPASDVYSWAKSPTKPTYSFLEISLKPTTISGYGITNAYTKSEVDGIITGLHLGNASKKNLGSVSPGNTNLVTGGDIYDAINTMLTSSMIFRGVSSSVITDNGTQTAIINNRGLVAKSGDIVIYNGVEFVWDGSKWVKLGDNSSYALKTLSITAGTGLTGGGDLSNNRTIALSDSTIAALNKANTALQTHQTLTNHAKCLDTAVVNQVLVSGANGYEWRTLGTNAFNSDAFITNTALNNYVNDLQQTVPSGSGSLYVSNIDKFGKTLLVTFGRLPETTPLTNITGADDLRAIEVLSGTGILKRTGNNVWSIGRITTSDISDLESWIDSKHFDSGGSGGGSAIYTETDPTVPAWAKKPTMDIADIPTLSISKINGLQTELNSKIEHNESLMTSALLNVLTLDSTHSDGTMFILKHTNDKATFAWNANTSSVDIINSTSNDCLKLLDSGGITFNGNKVWHFGNDGANSGLDADLLDGQDSSYYATASSVNGKSTITIVGNAIVIN